MILEPRQILKPVIKAEAGELITIAMSGHRALALVLAKEPTNLLVGVLRDDLAGAAFPIPFAFTMDTQFGATKDCLSHGKEWVFELVAGPESHPGNKALWMSPGVVFATHSGPVIFIPSTNDRTGFDGYSYNLATEALVESEDQGVPYLTWNIWASQDDRLRVGAKPLVSFVGTPRPR